MRFQDVKLKSLGTGLMGAGLLGLMLATCGTVVAQEGRDDAKPPQQEEPKQDEAKPAPKAEPKDAKPSREQEQPKADEAKPSKNEKQNSEMKPGKDQDHPVQNNDRQMQNNNDRQMQNNDRAMQNKGGDHAQAGNQRGQRIPDDKFRSNFGRQHTFRVQTQVVEGQPRFQYGGYWFALANPWPGDWAYTDDCYVDYIDGEYVLIDLRHPGVQLMLIVVE